MHKSNLNFNSPDNVQKAKMYVISFRQSSVCAVGSEPFDRDLIQKCALCNVYRSCVSSVVSVEF